MWVIRLEPPTSQFHTKIRLLYHIQIGFMPMETQLEANKIAATFHTLLSPDGIFCLFSSSMTLHASLDTSLLRASLKFQIS